ncbi:MAG: NMD3-related protein [Candidatus Woesearchaeota archaeon]
MRFCPKCGKNGIQGDFCSECAEKELDLTFNEVVIKKCISCARFMLRNSWKEFRNLDEGIIRAAHIKIKNPKNAVLDITPDYKELKNKPGAKQEINLEIVAEGQDFVIPATIEFTYCDKCAKAGTQYFEGVLQLRDATPELLAFVEKDIAANVNEGAHVTTKTGKGGNIDFIMTSTKYMLALGKRLNQKFNGELTVTAKLFSRNRQTSKEVFRTSILFRMRTYKIGEIIETRGKKIKITTIGKKVSGIDTETGKKVFVD